VRTCGHIVLFLVVQKPETIKIVQARFDGVISCRREHRRNQLHREKQAAKDLVEKLNQFEREKASGGNA
jgi:hypothetical protein